jgi:hypothetical protein
MDKVRLALVLVTVAITVGPILGIVLVYRDNLPGLIIPPEINQIANSNGGNPENSSQPGQTDNSNGIGALASWLSSGGTIPNNISDIIPEMPGPEDIQYDPVTRTFTASFQVKNPSPFDMSVKSINGTVECDEHHFPIGPITLKNPVTVKAGGNATATITGQWTQEAIKHLEVAHPQEQSIKCSLVGAVISFTTLGISGSYPSPEPISLGDIPLT